MGIPGGIPSPTFCLSVAKVLGGRDVRVATNTFPFPYAESWLVRLDANVYSAEELTLNGLLFLDSKLPRELACEPGRAPSRGFISPPQGKCGGFGE